MNETPKHLLIYTGGTEAAFYRMIRLALEPHSQIKVREDGCIEFIDNIQPDIVGYKRQGQIFQPVWPSCRRRTLLVSVNNCLNIIASCQHPLAEYYLQNITLDNCNKCVIRKPIPSPAKMPSPLQVKACLHQT